MVLSHSDLRNKSKKAVNPAAITKGGRVKPAAGMDSRSFEDSAAYGELENISKSSLSRIEVSQMPKEIPDFQAPGATKDTMIAEWLKVWICSGLTTGKLTEDCLLPRKGDIARHLGVSVGTVQNAIRYIEDEGHVESKQRIGTMIRSAENGKSRMRKQTSKRDQAVEAVKHLIVERAIEPGAMLPSAREIAKLIGSAPNTTRLALEFLSSTGTLQSLGNRGNKANWVLQQIPEVDRNGGMNAIESETLIDQLERDLKALIAEQFDANAKLPSHLELSEAFKVSIKTVHDAMKRLSDQGIIQSKRGRYGTFVVRKPDTTKFYQAAENIFMPAEEASFYNYEKVEQHLKVLIKQNFKVGDKLPSMGALSKELDVSSNTVRKALQNLAKQGCVSFSRGRYGGTYVKQVPDVDITDKAFQWVSINPETIKSYRSVK